MSLGRHEISYTVLFQVLQRSDKMKSNSIIIKASCIALCLLALVFAPLSCAYASKEEILDLEEEKSDIEDRIEERRAQGKCYDDLEERRNDVQDEIDSVKEEG